MYDDFNKGLVPTFKVIGQTDPAASKKEGRPIYTDMEVVEIAAAGDKQSRGVFPAHAAWKTVTDENGLTQTVTYAMRFESQYRQFKERVSQTVSGTPLEELPFLTTAKRMELKALKIMTAEMLAGLEGQNLKNLGIGGREMKNQAQAYLDSAAKSSDVTALAGENAALKEQIEALRRDMDTLTAPKAGPKTSPYDNEDDDTLKEIIAEATGARPRGNPSHETLVRMADEIAAKKAKDKEAA